MPTLGAFRRVLPAMRIAGGSLPVGRGPVLFVTGFVRVPLSRLTERACHVRARRLSSLLRHGRHPCRSAASPRSRASHRVGRCGGDPGPYDRRLQPTRYFFNDVRLGLGSLRFASMPTRSGSTGFTPVLASVFRLRSAAAFSSACASSRRPSGLHAALARRAYVTSTRPRRRERPSRGSLRRVNGRSDALLLWTPSALLCLSTRSVVPSVARATVRASAAFQPTPRHSTCAPDPHRALAVSGALAEA